MRTKLLLSALFIMLVTLSIAKDKKEKEPHYRAHHISQILAKTLDLDSLQKAKVQEALFEKYTQLQQEEHSADGKKGKKAQFKKNKKLVVETYESKMQFILTPDQYKMWVAKRKKLGD